MATIANAITMAKRQHYYHDPTQNNSIESNPNETYRIEYRFSIMPMHGIIFVIIIGRHHYCHHQYILISLQLINAH